MTDSSSPVTYIYSSSLSSAINIDGTFVTPAYTSGALSSSEIPTPGTPADVYYVSVKAIDAVGNSSPWTTPIQFTIDNTAPTLTLPSNITGQEATSAAGRVVTFSASSTDASPVNPTVTCVPASGSSFALGTTTVNCDATDTAGNVVNDSFTVTVVDTTKPVITLNGSDPVTVQVLGTYSESGASVTDNYSTGLTANITGTVDTNTV